MPVEVTKYLSLIKKKIFENLICYLCRKGTAARKRTHVIIFTLFQQNPSHQR